jgi:hypothetical protein
VHCCRACVAVPFGVAYMGREGKVVEVRPVHPPPGPGQQPACAGVAPLAISFHPDAVA